MIELTHFKICMDISPLRPNPHAKISYIFYPFIGKYIFCFFFCFDHVIFTCSILCFFVQLGGTSWTVALGRRDARTASQSDANNQLPSPFDNLATLISSFAAKGLTASDLTVLSGGHTIGQSQCLLFKTRIYNETNIDPGFATTRKTTCPASGGDTNLAPFDITPTRFDNNYYKALVARRGLLHSDQELFNSGSQDALVRTYSNNAVVFSRDFAAAMAKMSAISPLTGTNGEIRKNCRLVN